MTMPKKISLVEEYDNDICIQSFEVNGELSYKARVASKLRKKDDSILRIRCGTLDYVRRGSRHWRWERHNDAR